MRIVVILILLLPTKIFGGKIASDTVLIVEDPRYLERTSLGNTIIDGEIIKGNTESWITPADLDEYVIYRFKFQNESIDLSEYGVRSFYVLHVLSALRNGKKIVIADINRDGNFLNDASYEYSIRKDSRKLAVDAMQFVNIPYCYRYGNKVYSRDIDLKILPFDPVRYSAVSTDELLRVYFSINNSRAVKLKLGGRSFEMYLLGPRNCDAGYENCTLEIWDKYANVVLQYDPVLKAGEEFVLGNKSVKVNKVSFFGDSVDLGIRDFTQLEGIRVQNTTPDDVVNALQSKLADGAFFQDGYLLIDFWGSWCGPCISAIPKLKEIHKSFEPFGKLQMLSVAFERQSDTTILRRLIQKYKMKWEHIVEFDQIESSGCSLVSTFRIEGFPTTILINKDHKIIFRGLGVDSMMDLRDILNMEIK